MRGKLWRDKRTRTEETLTEIGSEVTFVEGVKYS